MAASGGGKSRTEGISGWIYVRKNAGQAIRPYYRGDGGILRRERAIILSAERLARQEPWH